MSKPKTKKLKLVEAPPPDSFDSGTMDFWRNLASQQVGAADLSDKWKHSEVATILQQVVTLVAKHYPRLSRIVDKLETCKGGCGVSIVIDRSAIVPVVDVKLQYAERCKDGSRVAVPDPEQLSLPILANMVAGEKPDEETPHIPDVALPA